MVRGLRNALRLAEATSVAVVITCVPIIWRAVSRISVIAGTSVVVGASVVLGASVVTAPAVEDEEAAAKGVAKPKTMSCSPTNGVGTLSVHAVLLSSILLASISACGISADGAPLLLVSQHTQF